MNSDFASAVCVPDDQIDLARAALIFARDAYPDLDPDAYLAQLDQWAEALRSAAGTPPSEPPFQPLNDLMFGQLGFVGSESSYYDPRNSYLNTVMDRYTGLPIALSAIYLEVGWRVGLPLSGVGLPGHFIVRCDQGARAWFIDPFNSGRLLSERDCVQLAHRTASGTQHFSREMLLPISKRTILARMLNNLKSLYIQREALAQARIVMERLLELDPDLPENTRDLGLVLFRLGTYRQAINLLESYYALNPRADDLDSIRQVVSAARGELARWN